VDSTLGYSRLILSLMTESEESGTYECMPNSETGGCMEDTLRNDAPLLPHWAVEKLSSQHANNIDQQ